MKKFLILTILIVLILSIILIKPKLILAEETTTPDYFINNELYLFDFRSDIPPNFETGYLDKVLITENDLSNDNRYFGWYKNLGYNQLILPYYFPDGDEESIDVMFGVQLFGCVAKTFSIAYEVSSPPLLDFYLFFSDGTYQEWNTEENGFGRQILTINPSNLDKNCVSFCWTAYSMDYVPSLKFLGISDSYNFGYNDGFSDGRRDGYTTGYNGGYEAGYRAGTSSDAILYTTLLDFNQLILNGDFNPDVNYWVKTSNNVNLIYQENCGAIQVLDTQATNHTLGIRTPAIAVNQNDKIYFKLSSKSETHNFILRLNAFDLFESDFFNVTNNWQTFSGYYTGTTTTQQSLWFYPYTPDELTTNEYYYLKDIQLFNLTKMYGAGNEPTIEQCNNIFDKEYYDYTQSTPIEIGYYTGYIDGRDEGIQTGINIGETNQINMNWIQEIFRAIQTFFNIQIFPRVTLGIIVGIPFIITLAWFVIKMFRGGGGGED